MNATKRFLRGSALALLATSILTGGCVEPFGGSNLQVTLAGSVQVPGLPAEFGRPPPDTHFEFYAVRTTNTKAGDLVVGWTGGGFVWLVSRWLFRDKIALEHEICLAMALLGCKR